MSGSWMRRAFSLSIVVVLVSTGLMACGRPSAAQLLASAKEYLAKGDRNAAIIELKNLLQQDANNGEGRLLLGQAYVDVGDYAAAEKELSRALELRQPQEQVLPAYVRVLLAQGKYQAVVSEVQKYKLFSPAALASTQTALGDAYRYLRDPAKAREAYSAALAAVDGYPRARLGEAILVASEGRIDEALARLDDIIAAEPNIGEARAFRAEVLLVKGDRPGAIKELKDAVTHDPSLISARFTLIQLLIDDRDFDAAAKVLGETRRLAPRDLQGVYWEAMLAYRAGQNQKARQSLEGVLKHLPEHVPSLALAGAVEISDGKFQAAEIHLRKVLSRAPGHQAARLMLVQALLQMGQPAKAKDVLQPLVEGAMPRDQRILLFAAETYLANGELERAMSYYRAAASGADVGERLARTRLGQIALATGKSEEGIKELESAADLGMGTNQADLALIAGHLMRKDFDRALDAVKALEKKQPTNPQTFHMYGLVNLSKGDTKEARTGFEKALALAPTYLPAAYNLAGLDLLDKKPEDARKRLQAVIDKDPGNEQPHLALAEIQRHAGAPAKDIDAALQRAVSANPQSVVARVALVNFRLRSGELKAALVAAQDAQAALPVEPRVLEVTGAALEAAGQIHQAIETFNKLAAARPDAVQPLYRLAALYLRQNDTEKAIESLRRIQRIAPREHDVVFQLVHVYLAAGRHEEAVKEARALQKREPKFAGGYAVEADVYATQRDFAQAERLYREALKLEPNANIVAIKLHSTLAAAGKMAEADALGRKWIAEFPKDTMMRRYLAGRELAAKNLRGSAAHYREVIAVDPNDVEALNNLAWIGGQLKDPKALSYAERAMALEPRNASVLDTYGMLLVGKGDADKGLQYVKQARELAPARNELRLNYAKAMKAAGDKDGARKELEALLAVKEAFPGKDEVATLLKGL